MNYMKSNKKGVKLLATIMAFAMVLVAGFAIIGNTDDSDAVLASTESDVTGNTISGDTITAADSYKVTEDTTVSIPGKTATASGITINLYLEEGKQITITGTTSAESYNVTVVVYAANSNCTKYISGDSTVSIVAMTNGSIVVKNDSYGAVSTSTFSKLLISGEVTTGTVTGANDVSVKTESTLVNKTVTSPTNIASIKYGVEFKNIGTAITYYPVGASVSDITIDSTDTVKVLNGTVKVKYSTTHEIQFSNAVSSNSPLTVTSAATPTINGTITGGSITAVKGAFVVTTGQTLVATSPATINAYTNAAADSSTGFAETTKISATHDGAVTFNGDDIAQAALYVYGNIASNKSFNMGTAALNFKNANVNSVTVTTGGAEVKVSATGDSVITDKAISGLTGTLTIISGELSLGTETSGTCNVLSGATLKVSNNFNLTGKIYVYGTITADADKIITVKNKESGNASEFRAFSGCVIGQKVTVSIGGTGDVAAVIDIPSESKTVSGTVMSDETYTQSQDVVVSGFYDVKNSSTVTIAGSFEVPEGTTVTIYNGATITVTGSTSVVKIAGKLVVEQGGTFSVNGGKSVSITGTVQSEGTLTLSSMAVSVENGGVVKNLGTFAPASTTPMNVGAGSELRLGGTTNAAFVVKNSGLVVFDEVEFGAQVTVSNVAAGATVKIISFSVGTFEAASTNLVTINDDDLIYNNVDVNTNNNAVMFKNNITAGTKAGYSGLTITSSVALEGTNNDPVKKLDISGTVEIYNPNSVASGDLALSIETSGTDVTISDKVTLSDKVVLTVSSGVLLVSGELSALTDATAQVVPTGKITVTGQMVLKTDIDSNKTANVNAAYYKTKNSADATIHNYSTLSKAIEAGATEIKTYGTLNVLDNVDVPAGTTVNANGAVNIGSTTARNVKVSFANGATLKVTSPGAVSVYGTLEFENKKDNKVAAITSDVSVIGDVASKYTNIYTALGAADKGDVITITKQDAVTIDADITVKAGVTLSVPVGKSVTVNDNVTVTINGTVIAYSGFGAQSAFSLTEAADKSTLVVNGKFMTAESELNDVFSKYKTYGAYYVATTDLGTYTYIAPLTVAVEDAQTAGILTLYGENKFSSVKVEATETKPVNITFATSSVIEGDIEISNYVTIDATNTGVRYDGNIKSAVGEIDIVNMRGFKVQSSLDTDKNEILGVYKAPVKSVDTEGAPTQKFVIAGGIVTAHGTDANKFDADGAGLSIDTGATLRVTGAMEVVNSIVKGTLEVANGATLNVDEYLQINGTLTVAEAVTDKGLAAGSATIPALYIGVSKSSVGAAASVSAPSITNLTKVFLGAGSTISEDLLTGLVKNTKFVVDGADYMTVFTSVNINISTIKKPTVDGAEVTAWQYVNSSGKLVDITGEADKKVGEVTETTAKMKYDVYKVSFLVDSGVSDVYIDGVLVGSAGISGSASDIYLTAGTHQVTYKLKAGYGGDIIVTFDGKKATDGKFTISTDMPFKDDNKNTITYKIVISGAVVQDEPTPAPAEKDDGMGITDYLLIVLVILAAILVVVVAIRMMRS